MKYSTQHKYECSEAYDKWALKNIKGELHKPIARQAFRAAWRPCNELSLFVCLFYCLGVICNN